LAVILKIVIRNIILLFLILSFGFTTVAQDRDEIEESRSVVINLDDYNEVIKIAEPEQNFETADNYIYFWYRKHVVHQTRGSFSGDLLNGDYISYYNDNALRSKGVFYWGLKDGVWQYWRKNATLERMETWKKGLLHGNYILYNEMSHDSLNVNYKKGFVVVNNKDKEDTRLVSVEVRDSEGNVKEKRSVNVDDKGNVSETIEQENKKKECFLKRWFGKKDEKEKKDSS
jgi:antitoxin component YwqK of YwqJK toxin-antitoxin module